MRAARMQRFAVCLAGRVCCVGMCCGDVGAGEGDCGLAADDGDVDTAAVWAAAAGGRVELRHTEAHTVLLAEQARQHSEAVPAGFDALPVCSTA